MDTHLLFCPSGGLEISVSYVHGSCPSSPTSPARCPAILCGAFPIRAPGYVPETGPRRRRNEVRRSIEDNQRYLKSLQLHFLLRMPDKCRTRINLLSAPSCSHRAQTMPRGSPSNLLPRLPRATCACCAACAALASARDGPRSRTWLNLQSAVLR